MTWTSPPTVATGDLYTAAMFNTYTRDNPNHLRAVTGGADPAAANRVVVSSSSGPNTAWGTVPDLAMTNQKVNQQAPVYASFGAAAAALSGLYNIENGGLAISDTPLAGVLAWYLMQVRYYNTGVSYSWQLAQDANAVGTLYQRIVVNGTPSAWTKNWNASNDGAGSGADADLLDGLQAGNASNNIPISNNSICAGLNANFLANLNAGNSSTNIPINNTVVNIDLNADMVDSHHAADITPNNLRGWFNSVAEVGAAGAHWARDTATDGRLLIGGDEEGNDAGLVVFTPGTTYGSHWFPMTGLAVTVGTLGVTVGAVAPTGTAPAAAYGFGSVTGVNLGHTHPAPTGTVTGAPALTGVATSWLPLMRAGVWAKKV